jgi:hypothetical protein
MNDPSRWGGLKVHAPRAEQPPRDSADPRRRQAFANVATRQPAAPPKPGALPSPSLTKAASKAPPPALSAESPGGSRGRTEPTDVPLPSGEPPPSDAEPRVAGPDLVSHEGAEQGEVDLACDAPERLGPLHAALAIVDAAPGDLGLALVAYLSSTVTSFCNNAAVRDADGWSISIQLNGNILCATTLHLRLTLHWLILRFECADAQARRLVLAHRAALTEALVAAVSPRREVSVDVD